MTAPPAGGAPADLQPTGVATLIPLRLATRRSPLAMAQSRRVGEQLAALTGRPLELVEVTTRGDVDPAPLSQIGGTGVFVVAVRQALVDGRADVAVHSLKDLPTSPDARLHLAADPAPGGPPRRPGGPCGSHPGDAARRRPGRHGLTPPARPDRGGPS